MHFEKSEPTFDKTQVNDELIFNLISKYHNIMYLKIYVDNPEDQEGELKKLYYEAVKTHNEKLSKPNAFIDAGFDLYYPTKYDTSTNNYNEQEKFMNDGCVKKLDMKVKCSASMITFYQTCVFPTWILYVS